MNRSPVRGSPADFSTCCTYDLCSNRIRTETDGNRDGLPETVETAYNANDRLVTETPRLHPATCPFPVTPISAVKSGQYLNRRAGRSVKYFEGV